MILDIIVSVYTHPLFICILGLLLINILVGIAVSLYTKNFYLGAIGDWLLSRALPYVLVAGSLSGILIVVPDGYMPDGLLPLKAVGHNGIWLMVIVTLIGKILNTLNQVPGINIWGPLTDKPITVEIKDKDE